VRDDDPDPQELLPVELRADWLVVPKTSLWRLCLAVALIAAGIALSIVGISTGDRMLASAFPAALALAKLQGVLLPWPEERLLAALRARQQERPRGT